MVSSVATLVARPARHCGRSPVNCSATVRAGAPVATKFASKTETHPWSRVARAQSPDPGASPLEKSTSPVSAAHARKTHHVGFGVPSACTMPQSPMWLLLPEIAR